MTQSPPIVRTPDQQHMLFLFVPLKKGTLKRALHAAQHLAGIPGKSPGSDTRAATGVHFAMFYGLEAGTTPPGMPVPTFATAEGKDLLVALAIYDADFGPYISAFTNQTTWPWPAQPMNFQPSVPPTCPP